MTDREAFEAWWNSKPWPPGASAWAAWQAALASERAKPNEWKEAIIDKLVVGHILQLAHESEPLKAINDLLAWETQLALDPQVSSQAQALIDRGAAAERAKQQCAGVGDSHCNYLGLCGQVCNKCGRIHDGERTTFMRAKQAEPVSPPLQVWACKHCGMSDCAPPAVQAEPVQTTKEAWWAGYRAGKGLPADTPRQEALAAPPADEAVTLLSEWLDRVDDDDPTLTLEWVEGFEKRVRDFLAKVGK